MNRLQQPSRRDLFQLAAASTGSLLLTSIKHVPAHAEEAVELVGTNWAGNVKFSAKKLQRPETVEELQRIVRESDKVHAVGGRHSFSDIADTKGTLVSLDRFNQITVDRQRSTVDVGAGVKYSNLCPALEREGLAVENLASLPHICVVGASATATHGSGTRNLASQVAAIEFVNGRGERVRLSEADTDFPGAVVGLGAVGIVTQLTLRVVPNFEVRQWVWEKMPLGQFVDNFDVIMGAGYSVSGFTTWRDDQVSEVWVKRRADDGDWDLGPNWFGATPAPRDRHPIVTMDPTPCTAQMGVAGPAWERLPHFRPDHPPSSKGRERHSEYFIDRRSAVHAIGALYKIGPRIAGALQISEIRTVLPDNLWMSTAYQRDCVCLHFTWTEHDNDVAAAMPIVEAALDPFEPRPHWGKMHTRKPRQVAEQFARIGDFRKLCRRQDPNGKFRNAYLDQYVFGVLQS
jgi:xylitol oxidase